MSGELDAMEVVMALDIRIEAQTESVRHISSTIDALARVRRHLSGDKLIKAEQAMDALTVLLHDANSALVDMCDEMSEALAD